MDIKEIAQKLAPGYWNRDQWNIEYFDSVGFAEALIESYKAGLLKEAGEPVAYSIFICGEPCDVYLNKDDAESEYTRRNERYPDKTRSLQYLFTSDQLAAAILKATKPLEDQLVAAQEEILIERSNGDHWRDAYSKWVNTDESARRLIELQEQLAKAEQRVAELEAEVERLKRTNSSYANLTKAQESQLSNLRQRLYQLKGADSAIDSERQANCELTEQLAAEQLNNKLLRKALEAVIKVHGYESGIPVEAVSTPASTEALDKYVAEKVKEALTMQQNIIDGMAEQIDQIATLTRQRDLAVDALEKIAAPVRVDGTYNRCREACEILARETLSAIKETENNKAS